MKSYMIEVGSLVFSIEAEDEDSALRRLKEKYSKLISLEGPDADIEIVEMK